MPAHEKTDGCRKQPFLFVTQVTFYLKLASEICSQLDNIMNLINRIKTGWTFLKFIRVGLGSLILYSSVQEGQAAGMILGAVFTLFALFSDGSCCMAGNCYISQKNDSLQTDKEPEYEELASK